MNMQLDSHIKAAFDEIVAQTPELGDTPSVDLVPLTAAGGRQPHHWMLLTAAAAVVVIGAAGLIALRSDGSAGVGRIRGDDAGADARDQRAGGRCTRQRVGIRGQPGAQRRLSDRKADRPGHFPRSVHPDVRHLTFDNMAD